MNWRRVVIFIIAISLLLPASTGYHNKLNDNLDNGKTVKGYILWDNPKRLTWMGNSTNPVVKSDHDGNYDVVWQDHRNGNWDIYYLKITSWGFKLVNDTRITDYQGDDINPSIATIKNYTFVVWQRFVNSHWAIYFSRLLYNNENITIDVKPKALTTVNRNCTNPKVGIDSNGFLHVVWQEYEDNNWEIMYDKIDQSGNPVFKPIDVSNDNTNSTRPEITVDSDSHIHIFWVDDAITPGYSVFYRGLDCCGYFITNTRRISVVSPNTTITSYFYGGYLYTAFSCSRENLSYEVIFTKLNETGVTVIDDKNLTSLDGINSLHPQIIVAGGRIFLTWYDSPAGSVKFSNFNDYGNISGGVFNVSTGDSYFPSISLDENNMVIVWDEITDNGVYLYMREGSFPNLYVKSMDAHSQDENVILNVTIGSIWNFNVSVEYSLIADGNIIQFSQILLGNEKTLSFNFHLSGGEHNITFILDPNNRIFETREDDNYKGTSIFIKHYDFEITTLPRYYVKSGNFTNISIVIENKGNWADKYELQMNYSKSYFVITPNNMSITLNPGDYRTLNFTLLCPENTKIGNYTVNLSATSLSTKKSIYKEIDISVEPYLNFQVNYNLLYYSLPGKFVNIGINVANMGNCNDTYIIKVGESENWILKLENDSLFVPWGKERKINITVYIPNGTLAFKRDILVVLIESEKSHDIKNATLGIVVMPYHSAFIEVTNFEKTAGEYTIDAKIFNNGNILDFYNLNLTGFLSNYSYLSQSSLLLPPGGNSSLQIDIYPLKSLEAGAYSLNLNVYSGNISLISYPISITIEAVYNYEVNVKKISEGKNVVFDIELKNEGNAVDSITIIPFVKSKNITWIFTFRGRNYTNETTVLLNPNETVHVKMMLKSKLKEGNYKLYLFFTSSSGINKNKTESFLVGEKKGSIWDWFMNNILYISIAVIAIVLILIYFAKRE